MQTYFQIDLEVPMKNSIRISRSAQFLWIVALFSFAFYSCDSSKPNVAAPIHSCEILTISEVEGILATAVLAKAP